MDSSAEIIAWNIEAIFPGFHITSPLYFSQFKAIENRMTSFLYEKRVAKSRNPYVAAEIPGEEKKNLFPVST